MQLFFRIPRVSAAFLMAVEAHKGQSYGHLPYFTHFLEVAEEVPYPTEDELVAAMLHDIVEDTEVTLEQVSCQFGDNVSRVVSLLTKNPDLSYQDNIFRIIASKNKSAMKIKWADNLVNMRNDKSHMDQARRDKLNDKYAGSFCLLSSAIGA